MNNLASYSPLFHTAICYWGFKMVLFIIIEWAFLNLATVFHIFTVPSPATVPLLSRILPSDACKIYKQGLNIRQVLSTDAVSFRDKNRTLPQWGSLELQLNLHASALWDLTGSFFLCHESRFLHENLSLSMDERSSLWSGLLCFLPAPGLSHLVFKISPYYSGAGGWNRQRRKEKGGRFIYILVAQCLWPLILLLLCLSVRRWTNTEPFLLSPTSYRIKKSNRNPMLFSVKVIESSHIYNSDVIIQGLVRNHALFSGDRH